jgi:radical SAM superfamily enzyme YgiQ (UPF0313 family)
MANVEGLTLKEQRICILLIQPFAPYAPRGFAPLSVATVAGITPDEFHVDIWDELVRGPIGSDIPLPIQYNIVGISVTFPYQLPRAVQVAREFREKGVLTVIGGAFPTSNPAPFRGRADVLIIGECEELWPRFLRDWRENRHQSEYRQITPPDLSHAPPPNWDSLAVGFGKHYARGSVQTTRGCPFDCEFCDVIYIYGRKQRHKPTEMVIREIQQQHELGVQTVFLADDAFEADPKYAKGLLEALIPVNNSLEPPMAFEVQCGVNVARSHEFLRLLADSNFELLWMGVESTKRESLISINKLQNVRRDMLGDLRRIAWHGIGVAAYMIIGIDEDDSGIFDQHIQFWNDALILIPIVNILTAIPHTKLWIRLAREGRLLPTPGAREGIFDLTSNVVPKNMSRRQLIEGYCYLLDKAADLDFFAERLRRWIDYIKRVPEISESRLSETRIQERRAALLGGGQAHKHFDDLVAYTTEKKPSLLRRVLSYVEHQDSRSHFLKRYHLPQLAKLIQKRVFDQRASGIKWTIPIPEGFRTAFRSQILPRVYARVHANLLHKAVLAEALTKIFTDFLVRFAHEYGNFQESHARYLEEIADKICAQFNGISPEKFIPNEPTNSEARGASANEFADGLLKAIAEDLIKRDPSLHGPEQKHVYLG